MADDPRSRQPAGRPLLMPDTAVRPREGSDSAPQRPPPTPLQQQQPRPRPSGSACLGPSGSGSIRPTGSSVARTISSGISQPQPRPTRPALPRPLGPTAAAARLRPPADRPASATPPAAPSSQGLQAPEPTVMKQSLGRRGLPAAQSVPRPQRPRLGLQGHAGPPLPGSTAASASTSASAALWATGRLPQAKHAARAGHLQHSGTDGVPHPAALQRLQSGDLAGGVQGAVRSTSASVLAGVADVWSNHTLFHFEGSGSMPPAHIVNNVCQLWTGMHTKHIPNCNAVRPGMTAPCSCC